MVGWVVCDGFAGAVKHAALIALMLAAPLVQAHDFGGQSGGGRGDAPPPGPPCNSCPCSGPGGGGGDGGGGNGGGPGNSTSNPSGSDGKPVSFFNGAEEMSITDLVVEGVMPIVIQRKYDSRSSYDSPLGYGWAFMHDRRLYEYPDNSVVVRHGCGTRDRYVSTGGGYATPVGSMLAKLSALPDGSFQLSYLNGIVDTFDSQGRLISSRDARGNSHEYTYDTRGKLPLAGSSKESIAPTQPMTVAQNFRLTRIDERGANGTLTGRHVTFAYSEATGRLTSVASNDGRTVTYQHDVSGSLTLGNLTQVNGLAGVVGSYAYADPLDPHNLTSIIQTTGRTPIVNTYDAQDRVISQQEGTRRMDIAYAVPYQRTTVTKTIRDQNGLNPYTAATTYEFDTTGRVIKVVDPLGHETRYSYNSAKLLVRKELWQKSGQTLTQLQATEWAYDSSGNKLTEVVTSGGGERITRSWTYENNWIASKQVVSSADPGKVFRTEYTFHYGPGGVPVNIQSEKRRKDDGTFQTTTHAYDDRHRLLTTTAPDGVQMTNEYTGEHLTRTYFVVGGVPVPELDHRFEHDAGGNVNKSWDARGNLTQYAHDDLGRMVSTINPLGEQTLYVFEEERLSQIETGRTLAEGEGQIVRFQYDSQGRLTGIQRKNDLGTFVNYHTFQLDSLGRRLVVTDAENNSALLSYDLVGRLKTVTDPSGKMMQAEYDAAGNRVALKDALNREIRFEFDGLNRVTAITELGIAPNPRTLYSYDAVGNITSVTDAENRTTTYVYDALGRATRVVQPLGQFVEYAYDSRDRLDFMINARGNKIDYTYEPWGELKQERHFATASATSPLRTVSYTYDADGNILSIIDDAIQAAPAYTFSYDASGRLYDENVKYLPGADRVLRHRYDRFGNRQQVALADSATVAYTYARNKLNQLVAANLAGAAVSIGYLGNDARASMTLPNGSAESYTYYANGLLQNLTFTGPAGQLEQLLHTYDDVGNLDTQTDQHGVHNFDHDALYRLTGVLRPSGSGLPNESYSYDRVGNRKDPASAGLYSYDGNNRISASPGLTYAFDADGSLQSRSDGAAFTHDAQNRLVQYVKGSTNASYLNDARGRRIRKTVNGLVTWFVWDGTSILAEYDSSGNRTRRYAYLEGDTAPIQFEDVSGTYYVHSDRLRAPRWITNSSAAVVWGARYEGYGRATVQADPDGNGVAVTFNLRLPGQYEDAESGLHYNVMRDYDPAVGRYISADPLGLAPGPNPYMYTGGRPTDLIDPLGLYSDSKIPTCVAQGAAKTRKVRRNWHKKEDDYEYRYKLREVIPEVGIGPMSSRNPRLGPSWNARHQLWRQRRLISISWNGHTVTTYRDQLYRCEAKWQEECGKPQEFVSWQTKSELVGIHAFWGEPTRYVYDWEWIGPAGDANFPGT